MKKQQAISVMAYAKINLTLDVLRRRDDGYHEVKMIMQSIALADRVEINEQEKDITVSTDFPGLPCDQSNLAYQAAALLQERLAIQRGAHIKLIKKIPLAAGLAGGSSDAAAVLRGLNQLWKLNLPMETLQAFGAELGSDVPFCLQGGTMLAVGRGEIVTCLPDIPPCWLILAKPPVDVSTAWVYGNYNNQEQIEHPDTEGVIRCLYEQDLPGVAARLGNVLETVTIPAHPEIAMIKRCLQEHGALGVLMSGSGPTVFGIMPDQLQAERAAEHLSRQVTARIIITNTVTKVVGEHGTTFIAD